jgi:uncharacterized membrane protein YidH (DUF202 family)
MKFATRRLDYAPTVRKGALVPDHVDSGVLAIILSLIELIKEVLVVLAGGLVGAGYGRKFTNINASMRHSSSKAFHPGPLVSAVGFFHFVVVVTLVLASISTSSASSSSSS